MGGGIALEALGAVLAFCYKEQKSTQVISSDEGCRRNIGAMRKVRVTGEPRHRPYGLTPWRLAQSSALWSDIQSLGSPL